MEILKRTVIQESHDDSDVISRLRYSEGYPRVERDEDGKFQVRDILAFPAQDSVARGISESLGLPTDKSMVPIEFEAKIIEGMTDDTDTVLLISDDLPGGNLFVDYWYIVGETMGDFWVAYREILETEDMDILAYCSPRAFCGWY